jgi:hypothetical protein
VLLKPVRELLFCPSKLFHLVPDPFIVVVRAGLSSPQLQEELELTETD